MSDEKKLSERVRRGDFAEWRGKDIDGYPDYRLSPSRIADEIAALEKRLVEAERLHSELLFCVAQKIPGETCHETALRYIKERESREVPGSPQENTHD